jgi:hypothetical protein
MKPSRFEKLVRLYLSQLIGEPSVRLALLVATAAGVVLPLLMGLENGAVTPASVAEALVGSGSASGFNRAFGVLYVSLPVVGVLLPVVFGVRMAASARDCGVFASFGSDRTALRVVVLARCLAGLTGVAATYLLFVLTSAVVTLSSGLGSPVDIFGLQPLPTSIGREIVANGLTVLGFYAIITYLSSFVIGLFMSKSASVGIPIALYIAGVAFRGLPLVDRAVAILPSYQNEVWLAPASSGLLVEDMHYATVVCLGWVLAALLAIAWSKPRPPALGDLG